MIVPSEQALEWLDPLVSEWNTVRVKGLFSDSADSISTSEMEALEVDHFSIPAFDSMGSPAIEDGASIDSNKKRLNGGELLFSKLNSHKPRVWLVPAAGDRVKVCSTEFLTLVPWPSVKVSKQFFAYLLSSAALIDYITCFQTAVTNSHRRIKPRNLLQTHTILPPLPEQKRIAVYLDASCAAIDRAVETKKHQLETLDALRTSIIQQAVTQGLNPMVEMKDSGTPWVPRVPSHWKVTRIKREVNLVRGQFTPRPRSDPRFYGGPYPFIQTGSISATEKYITEYKQTLNEDGLRVSRMFPSGTIVMTITGAKIGEVAMTTFDACFPDSVVGFIPNHHIDNEFLFYLLVAIKPALLQSIIVTTQPNINYVQLGSHFISFPEIAEQKEIVEMLEISLGKLKGLRESLGAQISTLTAYRKSLIHECVTGKRRITNADLAKVGAHV